MCATALYVVVVVFWDTHNVATHEPEPLPLHGLGVHIGIHFIYELVVDLKIPQGNLISDKEKTVLDMLAIFPALILPFIDSRMVDLLY